MKRTLLVLTFLFFSSLSFSQDYIPFPDSVANWNYQTYFYDYNDGNSTSRTIGENYLLQGDTLINDTAYSKLHIRKAWYKWNWNSPIVFYPLANYSYEFIGGIREDEDKKVWYRNMNWGDWFDDFWVLHTNVIEDLSQSNEFLIYDFSFEVGDSVWIEAADEYYAYVEEVTYDILGRRTITFAEEACSNPNYRRIWVEGIGDLNGNVLSLLGTQQLCFELETHHTLICFQENGEDIYQIEEGTFGIIVEDCDSEIIGIDELDTGISFEVYPNPSTGKFQITLNHTLKSSLEVFDLSGQLIFQITNLSDDIYDLDLSVNSDGLYYLVLKSEDGNVATGKVVKY